MKGKGLVGIIFLMFLTLPMMLIFGGPTSTNSSDDGGSSGSGGGLVNVPDQYRDLVLAAGSRCPQIAPSLIAAQIEVESNWNPNAKSYAGAQGISQFMPGTWASVGEDFNKDGKINVWDPADAIQIGRASCRERVLRLV